MAKNAFGIQIENGRFTHQLHGSKQLRPKDKFNHRTVVASGEQRARVRSGSLELKRKRIQYKNKKRGTKPFGPLFAPNCKKINKMLLAGLAG
jgi:hypothetical protein